MSLASKNSKEDEEEKVDFVLVDDDSSLIAAWRLGAKEKGLVFASFRNAEDLLLELNRFDKSTPIYLDYNLAGEMNGLECALVLHGKGYLKIYIETGYEASEIGAPNWISGVIGKDFPFI